MPDHLASQSRRAHLALAAVFAAAAVILTSCTTSAPPEAAPTPTMSTPTGVPGVDDRDPDAVLLAVAELVYTWRPGEDTSPAAGFDRAQPLLDPDYITAVGPSAEGLAEVTGATWARWAAQRATVQASARITGDDHPADTPTRHQRVVLITQQVTTETGIAAEPERTLVAYMTATRLGESGAWRVSIIAPRGARP